MKLFFKSAPLQLPELTRLRDPDKIAEWWNSAGLQYAETMKLLLGLGSPRGPGIHSLQLGPHTFSPLDHQLSDPVKRQHSFIPDIRQYLANNGITDKEKQDAFIDNDDIVTPRIIVDKEAADVHEKMARATRQSAFGRNNPGYEFGESAEIASHDFGDIRHFEHPVTGSIIPLFHVRRAVVVNRSPNTGASSANIYFDPELYSGAMDTFKLGNHPSYGYLGVTHTHPAFGHVTPSTDDRKVHDNGTPYGYSQIIRPGINTDEFTRQVTARYGSPMEAISQWMEGGDDKNMALRYGEFLVSQNPRTVGTGRTARLYAEGKDRTGMPLKRDSRLFMVRQGLRPLRWGSEIAARTPESATNYGKTSDFTSAHPHHVIYLGENDDKSERGTQQSIVSRPSFHAAVGTDIPILHSTLMSAMSNLKNGAR